MADDADTVQRQLTADDEPIDVEPVDGENESQVGDLCTDETEPVDIDDYEEAKSDTTSTSRWNPVRRAVVFSLAALVVVAALAGWLGTEAYKADQQAKQRELFLSVGRQAALNLTTIRANEADTDVQRIMDSSTGVFHEDFQKRSQPFVDLVKQTQASSEGTVTEAGVESITDDTAQILVSVAVKTTTPGAAPDQQPRLWRMRLNVQKVDDGAKVSDVVFVP